MILNDVTITIQRQKNGERQLTMQGRPMGLSVKVTLAQLDALITELIHDASVWRASLVPTPTYYDMLGVERTATIDDIKKAFRRLARRHHPDLHEGDMHAEMTHVNEAYEVLNDPAKRQQYDHSIP